MPNIREAALIPSVIAALVQFVLPFFTSLDPHLSASINAAVAFVAALVTAFLVSGEKGLAFLAGSGNALVQLALGFNIALSDSQQAGLAMILTLVTAAYTRTQVTAAKPASVDADSLSNMSDRVRVANQTGGAF